jgi:radical SAM superfamily enzyme YgiQ (UPF0313 family)
LVSKCCFVTASSYVLGLPFQTRESVLNDFELIRKAGSRIYPTFLTPLPGTIFHKNNYEIGEYSKITMEDLVINHSDTSDSELKDLFEKVRNPYWAYLKDFLKKPIKINP